MKPILVVSVWILLLCWSNNNNIIGVVSFSAGLPQRSTAKTTTQQQQHRPLFATPEAVTGTRLM